MEETRRLIRAGAAGGVPLRAVGGIAVWLRSPSLRSAKPPRTFHDIDLVGRLDDKRAIQGFLEEEGYAGHDRFNKLAGDRLIYADPDTERRVDVFLDRIEMCHTVDLRDCMGMHPETPPLSDLLLSKLQIAKLTDRDVLDVAALLSDHALGEGEVDPDEIDLVRIRSVCSSDWGWWRTVTGNLRALEETWANDSSNGAGPDLRSAGRRAAALREDLEATPKTVRWRARALVGERVAWYQEPEEVR